MHEFSVSATVAGPAATLVVTGDVDLATADRLRAAALPVIAPGRVVRIECAGVAFLDSAGLRVLLELDRTAREADADLILAAPSDAVIRTLELAGVAAVFTVQPTSVS